MTPAWLPGYIAKLQKRMELQDWRVEIEPGEPETHQGSYAEIEPVYGRKLGVLRVCSDFADLDRDVQRRCVVHELVHLHLFGLWAHAHGSLQDLLGKPAYTVFQDGFRLHLEHGVDAIATAWAEELPLPTSR